MDMPGEKAALRAAVRERLKCLTMAEMGRQSQGACERLAECEPFQAAKVLLVYSAMNGECDPGRLVKIARDMGKYVAYPRCEGSELGLYVASPCQLRAGAYGILEPDETCQRINAEDVDFAVIPGMAFDTHGGRLGRGKGYYDRLLRNMTAIKAGLCFNEQLVEHVPMDVRDCEMDMVVVEKMRYIVNKVNFNL